MPEKKKNLYPVMIIFMISGFLCFLIWSALQASSLGSKVTDADYYSKGLKYNTSQVEKRAAEVLGWVLETRMTGHDLEFHVTDRKGGQVNHVEGTLYLTIPGKAGIVHLPLQEISAGRYRVALADNNLTGTIQARLEMERQGARLNRQLLLNL